jgi:hypothetical protein
MSTVTIIEEVYDSLALSNQQIDAGMQIIKCFMEEDQGIRWAILLAQMQSGKTETYLFVCCELIRRNIVKEVVIFSGNAETDLRDQLKKEVLGLGDAKFYGKYDIYLEEKEGLSLRQRRPIMDIVKTHIIVLWGTELNKHQKNYNNTLFVWEEAHHAQSVHQCPDKFLHKVGISADGDHGFLARKGNFVVSISATPFSEISDFVHHDQSKELVYMRPGIRYNSVKNIMEFGRLRSFKNVDTGLREALSLPHSSPKYGLVRITNKNEETVKAIIRACGWKYVFYDSKVYDQKNTTDAAAKDEGDKVWKGMKSEPTEDIIILLRNKCRMGKNLEKEHVLFVMETCKSSNTDTILQGLLGRVCGYSDGSDRVIVFLHRKIVDSGELERYIELTDGDGEMIIPSNATNIAKTTIIKKLHPIVPFIVSGLNLGENPSRNRILRRIRETVANPDFDYGQTEETQFQEVARKLNDKKNIEFAVHDVSTHLTGTGASKEKWHKVSSEFKRFRTTKDNMPKAELWHTGIDKNGKKEGRIINVFYYSKDNEYGIPAGSAYVHAVTECKNSVYIANTNVPKTTEREIFAHKLEDGSEVVSNGGFVIHMPLSTSRDSNDMKAFIIRFVELSLEFPESRSVNSQWDVNDNMFKGILVNREVEKSLLPGGEIYDEVIGRFGCVIYLTTSHVPLPEKIAKMGLKRYASINW